MENIKYQIKRNGQIISIREFSNESDEWETVGTVRSIDKFNGKKVSEMTDAELIASYSLTSCNWSH